MTVEIKLSTTSPIVKIQETDRKTIKLIKVVIKKLLTLSALRIQVMDEKDLVFFSKSVETLESLKGEYEMVMNDSFQVNNHLTVGITPEDSGGEFEVIIHME